MADSQTTARFVHLRDLEVEPASVVIDEGIEYGLARDGTQPHLVVLASEAGALPAGLEGTAGEHDG
ncbi:MAG: hypothetical protein M3281_05680, partial [Chloroflexota bacterium]|nr:hypothetical protein [Chloroflexota bacterium]